MSEVLESRSRWLRRRPEPALPMYLWATTTATTADGVPAHLQVEFPLQVLSPGVDPEALAAFAVEQVERTLLQRVSAMEAVDLPLVGSTLDWTEFELPGAVTGPGHVQACDVEVTRELQRMLLGQAGP